MTRAADLDRELVWQRRLDSGPDELGTTQTFTGAQAALRAQLVDQQQDETAHESGNILKTVLTFRIRYVPGMKTGDWAYYNGNWYQIAAIKELGRMAWLEVKVKGVDRARC